MTRQLPDGLVAYKRTPVFDQDNLPAGFGQDHRTKPGVWGVIHILEGVLAYTSYEPDQTEILEPEAPPKVVEPCERHKVAAVGEVRFYVEFHRRKGRTA